MKKLLPVLAAYMFLVGCGFSVIDTGYRGVETRFGKVVSASLPEGFYFYNPFTSSINKMDTRVQRMKNEANTYTKDVQQAGITYVVNYFLEKDQVHLMYQEVGQRWEEILIPQAVEGALKGVIGRWDAVELVENREKARSEAENVAKTNLATKHVTVTRLELVNIQYLKEFEHAVEAKVIAIQRASEAANATKRIEQEAKQTIIAAQAQAESMRIRANALSQNKALVQYEAVLKWDGKMPQYMLGNSVPFINLKAD
ncbi:MAG TPA: prohibitin family protein [Acidiferrobacterales bacterium]|nr:prohibitin family protein [Acidiferrobacterales bacterium]